MHGLARLSLTHPVATLVWLGALTLVFAAGLPRVEAEYGYRVLIGDDHPAVVELDAFISRYGGGLPIEIGWACGPDAPCDDVFDRASMQMAEDVAASLRASPRVQRVVSPSTAPVLVPQAGGFAVRRFIENGQLSTDRTELAERASSDPSWEGALVSRDGRAAVITVQPSDSREETSQRVATAVLDALAPHEAHGFRFHLVGDPIQNLIVGRDLAESTERLIPFTVLVIGLILWALSRSLVQVAIALFTMSVALVWTFGLLGLLGWPQDGILEVLAPLVLVIGVCDAVHLLTRTARSRDDSLGDRQVERQLRASRLARATAELAGPCLLTSLTTTAAFLSFVTSNLATFVRFGCIAAFGVVACLVLSFTLLPVLVMLAPDRSHRPKRADANWEIALDALLRTSERRAVPILVGTAILLGLCGASWLQNLRVDHDWTESLGEESRVVQSQHFMEEHLGRSSSLEIEIALPASAPAEAPETLEHIARLTAWLEQQEGLGRARSILEPLGRLNRFLHDDRSEFDRPGDTRAANAQMLELAGFDEPGLVDRWTNLDRSRLRISVGAPEQAASTSQELLRTVRDHTRRVLPADWEVLLSGRVRMQAEWIEAVQTTQLRSFPTALALVFVLVAGFLRSTRLAAAALVPAVVPIVLLLGAMGALGVTLDVGRAMIAAILLGIAVDDAIHVLRCYASRQRDGATPRDAIRAAVLESGRAVTTTSLALALGFLTLMISAWQSIASFGFYAALAILGALAATLVVLPALVFAFARKDASSKGNDSSSTPHPGPAPAASRNPRRTIAAAVFLVATSAVAASVHVSGGNDRRALPCWVLPSGHVLTGPASRACPLHLFDEIRWVAASPPRPGSNSARVGSAADLRAALENAPPHVLVGVLRGGKERAVPVELDARPAAERRNRLISAAVGVLSLIGLAALLLRGSRSPVAVPLMGLQGAMAVAVLAGLATRDSVWLSRIAVAAFAFGVAALVHVGLVFPEERRCARNAPRLTVLPYAAALLLVGVAGLMLDRSPVLWPSFLSLLGIVFAGTWLLLVIACGYAARDSVSTIAKSRARLVLLGTPLIPVLFSAPLLWQSLCRSTEIESAAMPWTAAFLMPLPLEFAISRYNLFDLRSRARAGLVRFVHVSVAASVVGLVAHAALDNSAGSSTPGIFVVWGAAFCGVLVAEALRRWVLDFFERRLVPGSSRLARRLAEFSIRAAEPTDEASAVRHALREIAGALGPNSVTISMQPSRPGSAATEFHSPRRFAFDASLAATASAALASRHSDPWVLETMEEPDQVPLLTQGVAVVASIRHTGEHLGVILLGGKSGGAPYGTTELRFVAAISSRTGDAIHRARFTEARCRREREAEAARVVFDLMHEIGKDLGWIRRLVDRISEQRGDDASPKDVAHVQQLTRSLVRRLKQFVDQETAPEEARREALRRSRGA